MGAQVYSTGSNVVFVATGGTPIPTSPPSGGIPGTGTPELLGWGRKAPRIEVDQAAIPIMTDFGGAVASTDEMIDGQSGAVSVDLIRFNQTVLRKIEDRAKLVGNSPYIMDPGEMGTLRIAEGVAFQLWVRFTNAGKPAMIGGPGGAMIGGFHFYAAGLSGPAVHSGGLGEARMVHLNFSCLRGIDMSITNAYGAGRFILADYDMSAVNGLPLN